MLSGLFMSLLEAVIPEEGGALKRLAPSARRAWLEWLAVLATKGDPDVRDDFADLANVVLESFPAREAAPLVAALSPVAQRILAAG